MSNLRLNLDYIYYDKIINAKTKEEGVKILSEYREKLLKIQKNFYNYMLKVEDIDEFVKKSGFTPEDNKNIKNFLKIFDKKVNGVDKV